MRQILLGCWLIVIVDVVYVLWLFRQPEERRFAGWQVVLNGVAYFGGAMCILVTVILTVSWNRVKARGREGTGETRRSDDEIAAVRIGPPDVLDEPIHLAEYDPAWPQLYEREAARIRAALGDGALLLEHVGSTAVPHLPAKPRIDIVLAVNDSRDEASYVPALQGAGYVLRIREPDWYEHRVFKGPDTDVNLHVFSAGCPEIDRLLRFRDHLRRDEDDRLLYERTKRSLAKRTWKYTQHYADAKSQTVEEILSRAQA